MKRLLIVVVLVAACLLLFAAPASAWYAYPQTPGAYITSFLDENSNQWTYLSDPEDPFSFVVRDDPIPQGYDVVVTREWFDTRLGATLIPAEYFSTMAIYKDGSTAPIFAITKAVAGLRYFSPAYRFGDPLDGRVWARDWWVHLGQLPPGEYTGWVTQFAPRAVPLWIPVWDAAPEDLVVKPLCHPDMLPPSELNWTQEISFTVAEPDAE
jgi:hypothetical protein